MKIDNRTNWRTDDLRRIFAAGLDVNCKHEGPFPSKRLRVTVVDARSARYSGHAWLRTGVMKIRLPTIKHGALNARLVAAIFDHELQHCRGYRHAPGLGCVLSAANVEACAWADAFAISAKAPEPEAPREAVHAAKLRHALDKMKAAATRKKLAETIHRRWHRRVKYYERAIAAAAGKEG